MRDLPDHPNTEEFSDSLSNPPYDPDPENRKKIGENRATFDFLYRKAYKVDTSDFCYISCYWLPGFIRRIYIEFTGFN